MAMAEGVAGTWDTESVPPTADEIRSSLARILESPQFAGAERLRRFLTFVVEGAIAGRADEIKEFVVATAVFDRDQSYDSRIDAVVRVEAGRLRSRLAEYYAEAGSTDAVVIRVPKGGYAPQFERRVVPLDTAAGAPSTPPGSTAQDVVAPPPVARRLSRRPAAIAVVLLVASGAVAVWSAWTPASVAPTARASIAVLPLDGDTDAGGARVAESLSRELVAAGSLEVVAHSRVREASARGDSPSRIAELFNADYTVEGRLEDVDGRWTIELVLVDARRGRKLWVETFSAESSERAALVGRVATAVAEEVRARQSTR